MDSTAKLWDAATGEVIRTFTGHDYPVYSAAFSPDGAKVLTGSGDPSAKLWNTATGEVLLTLAGANGHTNEVYSVAYSPDGSQVLTGAGDNTAKLWNATTGGLVRTFTGHAREVYSVAFSPDGVQVLTGSADGKAKLWSTGAIFIREFTGREAIWSVTFSPDGNQVLVGAGDDKATLWGKLSGSVVRTFSGHTLDVSSVAFSKDGMRVLTGSADDTAKLWPVTGGQVDVSVPNVTGETQAVAEAAVTDAGLVNGTPITRCSDTVATGLVISQNPAAGQSVTLGSTVALVVSTGPCSVAVPNVVGQAQTAADTAITGAGLTVGAITQQCSNTVVAGLVISQNPAGGQQSPPSGAVALVISTGPCSVSVPNVVGQTQAAATISIGIETLTVGTVTRQCSNTVARDVVLSQNPAAGQQVLPGSGVTLVVSSGFCTELVPNVVSQTLTGAGAILAGANLVVGVVIQQCSNTVQSGLVISQNPAAGAQTPFGSAVSLVVSTGLCNTTAPNVVGQAQAAATAAITGASLTVGAITRQCSNTVQSGLVISQNPAAGAQAPFGSAVSLVLSTGLCIETVPNVVGQAQTDATTAITGASLTVGAVTQQCSNTVAEGKVASQNPAAGAQAPFGSAVSLVLSTGLCIETVPNVVGQAQAAATAAITGASLTVGVVTQRCSNTVPEGKVVSQNPAQGAQVPFGTPVALLVSTGLCNETVPSVVGQTQAVATSAITGAHLKVGRITPECSNSITAGTVITQDPPAGLFATFGSAVDLVVSSGLCNETVPNVMGQTRAAAATRIADASLTVGVVTMQCSNMVQTGQVINQTPSAGAQAPFGSAVALAVSSGRCSETVPNVVGQTQTVAGATLAGANLVVGTVSQQCSDAVPEGTVIDQNPVPGQPDSFGAAVALVLSTGSCDRVVPDVFGYSQAAATRAISDANLSLGEVTRRCSETVALGKVVSQTPAADTHATAGSAVALVVSEGNCNPAVPNLVGQVANAAHMAVIAANLTPGTITEQCSGTFLAGIVISQNPAAGQPIVPGSAVAMIVSTGPCGDTAPTEVELRDALATTFDTMDSNGDSQVSYFEALIALPGLPEVTFDAVDSNGDGQVSRAEAEFDADGGCAGCAGGKGVFTIDKMKKAFGDFFIAALGLGVLSLFFRPRSF
jgi:beta-lactam-binding protein with PASTA domain